MISLLEAASAEPPKIKGSRFLGFAEPVATPDAFQAFLGRIREEHGSATHHCYAFRFSSGESGSSDDGEPAGTAGRPILDRLVGSDRVDVGVVVVRYYGGTKLGKGGLVRAYGGAASAVIEAGEWEEVIPIAHLRVSALPSHTGVLQGVLLAHGATIDSVVVGASAEIEAHCDPSVAEAIVAAVSEKTAGRGKVDVS